MFGRVDLDIVSRDKKEFYCSDELLSNIGNFLLMIIKTIFPRLSQDFKQSFTTEDKVELKHIYRLATQLGVDDKHNLDLFRIPAISIVINNNIKPHCDSMNPTDPTRDFAFVLSALVPIKEIKNEKYRSYFCNEVSSEHIPICIILYNRKCLLDLAKKTYDINNYVLNQSKPTKSIVSNMIDLFHLVNSDVDYIGNFFTSAGRSRIIKKFNTHDKSTFKYPKLTLQEAADKMGFWSCLIHMFLIYIYKYGLKAEDVFCYVLFFSHQCNTTTTIVVAMIEICSNEYKKPTDLNLYEELCQVCIKLKNNVKEHVKMSDVGSGENPRFQTTNNKIYNKEEIMDNISKMNDLFGYSTKKLYNINKSNNRLMLELHRRLKDSIISDSNFFVGIGGVRANHLICLSSLLGLLPIEFYVNVPVHFDGGTGVCTRRILNIERSNLTRKERKEHSQDLADWNTEITKSFGVLFNRDVTPNMIENTLCIMGRGIPRVDIFYCLPYIELITGKAVNDGKKIQLCFRVNGNRSNDWNIECNTGQNIHTLFSNSHKELNRIQFVRDDNGNILFGAEKH